MDGTNTKASHHWGRLWVGQVWKLPKWKSNPLTSPSPLTARHVHLLASFVSRGNSDWTQLPSQFCSATLWNHCRYLTEISNDLLTFMSLRRAAILSLYSCLRRPSQHPLRVSLLSFGNVTHAHSSVLFFSLHTFLVSPCLLFAKPLTRMCLKTRSLNPMTGFSVLFSLFLFVCLLDTT